MRLWLSVEWMKARHRRLWLPVAALVAMQGLWLAWAVRDMDVQAAAQGYLACLYQLPMMNAIVMPVAAAVLVSRLCDMEHRGDTLKQLFTLQPAGSLFDAKLLLGAAWLLAAVAGQLAAIRAVGAWIGFTDALTPGDMLCYLGGQFIVSLFLALLLQVLALRYKNQFIPLAAGLILGFLGLMSMFFPPAVMRLSPAAYYGLLSNVRMVWDPDTRVVTYFHQPFSWGDLGLLAAATAVLYLCGRHKFGKKEA